MWLAEMGWDLMKSDKNKCDWYEIGSYQIYLDNIWMDETKKYQMGLDPRGSDVTRWPYSFLNSIGFGLLK